MDKTTALNYASMYANEVKKIYKPDAVLLYGSYAKDTHTEDSDIDIAVIFKTLNADYLTLSKGLYKLRRNICVDIEPILLDDSDNKSGFLNEIYQTGIVL